MGMEYTPLTLHECFSLQQKLEALKAFEPPSWTPVDSIDDERYAVVDSLKKEYLEIVDSIFADNLIYVTACEKIDKMKEIVATLVDTDTFLCERLGELVTDFETHEQLDTLKAHLNDQVARFHSLRSVLTLRDHGEKYMCFTCLERSVEVFLDPCGHVACEACQVRFGPMCPFCRVLITPKRMFLG